MVAELLLLLVCAVTITYMGVNRVLFGLSSEQITPENLKTSPSSRLRAGFKAHAAEIDCGVVLTEALAIWAFVDKNSLSPLNDVLAGVSIIMLLVAVILYVKARKLRRFIADAEVSVAESAEDNSPTRAAASAGDAKSSERASLETASRGSAEITKSLRVSDSTVNNE